MQIDVSVKQIAIKPGNNCNLANTVAICTGARKEKCQICYLNWNIQN